MGDTSIGLLDDCLTSLHTKQLQQRNKWRDAASRAACVSFSFSIASCAAAMLCWLLRK